MPRFARFSFVFVVLLFADSAPAGFRHFGVRDGLPSVDIVDLATFEKDIVFLTSEDGIARFDGVRWRTWNTDNGYPSVESHQLSPGIDGSLIISARGGIFRWDGSDAFIKDRPPANQFPGGIDVWDATETAEYGLWIASDKGVFQKLDGTWTKYVVPGQPAEGFTQIEVMPDGTVWAGAFNVGVWRFDGVGWELFGRGNGFLFAYFVSLDQDRQGNVWVGGSVGAARFDGSAWRVFGELDGLASVPVYHTYEDSRGALWFSCPGFGATQWDGQTWTSYGVVEGLINQTATRVVEDSQGAIWISSRGASRFDRSGWAHFTKNDGLLDADVLCVFEDDRGHVWVGAFNGVSRWDRTVEPRTRAIVWQPQTIGPNQEVIYDIDQDPAGRMWFASSDGGVYILDAGVWSHFGAADGLPSGQVLALLRDSQGRMWVATETGISRYDGSAWTHYPRAVIGASGSWDDLTEDHDGRIWAVGGSVVRWSDATSDWDVIAPPETNLPPFTALGLLSVDVDPDGVVWAGGIHGLYRYEEPGWTKFTDADGLSSRFVTGIVFDDEGALWIATEAGLNRMKDGLIGTYTTAEGDLPVNDLWSAYQDSRGDLWFGGLGVTRHSMDRTPPRSVPVVTPPAASASRLQTITWDAGFKDVDGTVFQTSFDGGPWDPPSTLRVWSANGLSDGDHELRIRGIDRIGNVELDPARVTFTIDGTFPLPVVTYPVSDVIAGTIDVVGTASDPRLVTFVVDVRPVGGVDWTVLAESETPVADGVLATWDTTSFAEGEYEVRVQITDDVGLVGPDVVRAIVDNEAPFAEVTSPVLIGSRGGEVFSTNGEARVYFPPGAFAADTVVRVDLATPGEVPEELPDGAARAWAGVNVAWSGEDPRKPGTLDLIPGGAVESPSVYVHRDTGTWEFLGGTWGEPEGTMSLPLEKEGLHALFTGGTGETILAPGIAGVSLTPRVLGQGDASLTIGFSLDEPGPLTVRVFNRAGRLVRSIEEGTAFGKGVHAVRWDGRNESGDSVGNGLYLIAIEARGQRETKTVSVVR